MKRPPADWQPAFAAFESGRLDVADQFCRQWLAGSEPPGEAFFLLGLIANKQGDHPASVAWLEQAAQRLEPSMRLWSALGGACHAAGDWARAEDYFTRCVGLDPQCREACLRLADLHHELRQPERAVPLYQRAAELNPEEVYAWRKLADTLRELGAVEGSLAAYARALALCPEDPVLHANRGRLLLAAGRLAEGFREFEYRWQPLGLRRYSQPVWRGEPLPGKTLLVFAEQGLGDTLQFVRFLPAARERVGRLVLECQPPLRSLLEQSHCGADIVIAGEDRETGDGSGAATLGRRGVTPIAFDAYVPLLHLPSIFQVTLATIPPVPRLQSTAAVTLPETPPGQRRVGLVWAGNPALRDDAIRSIPLAQLEELFRVPGVTWFNLQRHLPARDEAAFRASPLIQIMASVQDFATTAAMINQLDLVISVDTAVAHLAGALGKPVWTLLPSSPDWRWLRDRTDTPWYPTMRLFRQPRVGGWSPVVAAAVKDLINHR